MTTTHPRTPITAQVEDEAFAFGGYWKGTLADLIAGDGFRLSADRNLPCLLVEHTEHDERDVTVFHTNRDAHVARVFADALRMPIPGMSADPELGCFTAEANAPVWIRL